MNENCLWSHFTRSHSYQLEAAEALETMCLLFIKVAIEKKRPRSENHKKIRAEDTLWSFAQARKKTRELFIGNRNTIIIIALNTFWKKYETFTYIISWSFVSGCGWKIDQIFFLGKLFDFGPFFQFSYVSKSQIEFIKDTHFKLLNWVQRCKNVLKLETYLLFAYAILRRNLKAADNVVHLINDSP